MLLGIYCLLRGKKLAGDMSVISRLHRVCTNTLTAVELRTVDAAPGSCRAMSQLCAMLLMMFIPLASTETLLHPTSPLQDSSISTSTVSGGG